MSEIPRVFVDKNNFDNNIGIVSVSEKSEVHYLKNVHRIKLNDEVIVLDGKGNSFNTEVYDIQNKLISLKILEQKNIDKYPDFDITLFQGLVKGDKHSFIIQKATELGVSSIISFVSDFSDVKLPDSKTLNNKLDRFKTVALNASKQSKRSIIPEINILPSLDSILEYLINEDKNKLVLACVEKKFSVSIKSFLKQQQIKPDDIYIFIGPEGGWSDREINLFKEYNVSQVCLGDNILRADTAAIFAIGIILYEYQFS